MEEVFYTIDKTFHTFKFEVMKVRDEFVKLYLFILSVY